MEEGGRGGGRGRRNLGKLLLRVDNEQTRLAARSVSDNHEFSAHVGHLPWGSRKAAVRRAGVAGRLAAVEVVEVVRFGFGRAARVSSRSNNWQKLGVFYADLTNIPALLIGDFTYWRLYLPTTLVM